MSIINQITLNYLIINNITGASALHLAIAYSNNELVQDLVEAGAKVNQKATGYFPEFLYNF